MSIVYWNKIYRRLPYLLAMTGMILLFTACGQEEPVSDGEQPQPLSVEVHGDNTAGSEGTVPENSAEDGIGADPESPSGDSADIITENEDDSEDGTGMQQSDASDEEALGIDDETRQQLTEELLEENELDTSVLDNKRTTRECTFDLPEGFEESEAVEDLYVTGRYPLDTSMIYYAVMDQDTSMQLLTEELFKEQTEAELHRIYDEDIKIDIESFESTKISGYPAFRILCSYEADGIKVTQLQYAINADKTYMIIYSQTNDYDWMEAFEESAATIKVR